MVTLIAQVELILDVEDTSVGVYESNIKGYSDAGC